MEPLQAIILSAVAIAFSVAVAFWLVNIATQHTGIELVDVKATATRLDGRCQLTLHVYNRGTTTVTVLSVKVNAQPYPLQATVEPGRTATLTLEVQTDSPVLQVSVVTTRNEYPIIVQPLPRSSCNLG